MAQQQNISNNPYLAIFEQYVEEASFLWLLRSVALTQPHYTVGDLAELEQRIENHLDGLLGGPEEAWHVCKDALLYEEPGEVFTAAIVAFKSMEAAKIQVVVESACANRNAMKGLISALAWLPFQLVNSWLKKFIRSKDFNHKYIAISAYGARRVDPVNELDRLLQREDCIADSELYSRCLRLIGELKRNDLQHHVYPALEHKESSVRFWALWSGVLLGDHALVNKLEPFVVNAGQFQERATHIFFRAAQADPVKGCIAKMVKEPGLTRTVIQAVGVYGDPQAVPWLIQKMAMPQYARIAGESFSSITGINLDEKFLAIELPEDIDDLVERSEADETIELDADENLPWPDAEKIRAVWHKHGNQYSLGKRYFLGKLVTPAVLQFHLNQGTQRNRVAASLELALSTAEIMSNTSNRVVL